VTQPQHRAAICAQHGVATALLDSGDVTVNAQDCDPKTVVMSVAGRGPLVCDPVAGDDCGCTAGHGCACAGYGRVRLCGDGGCDDGGGARARAHGWNVCRVMPCDVAFRGGGAGISGRWCSCPGQRGKDGLLLVGDTVGKTPGSYVRVR
jgi:hypothetical protein